MLEAIRYVDLVIPENSWEQKIHDVQEYHIDTVVMGGDWKGSDKFDYLKDYCELVFLDRTPGISTSQIKEDLGLQEAMGGVDQLPDEPDGAPVGIKKITDLIIYPADFRRFCGFYKW